tara:strand:+ start:2938 stop:3135 length:198 start_codon:yes stop_codon:yes gene_type:complete
MADINSLKIGKGKKKKNKKIATTPYNNLSGGQKSILKNGLKVKTGSSYDRELRRLQGMYPGFPTV